jgi:pyridoxine 4-dehydrogenase
LAEPRESLGGKMPPPGLGTMQLTGPLILGPPPDWEAAVDLLRTARDLGVVVFDSAWYYGPHVTHRLLVDAFGPRLEELVVVTKAGNSRGPGGSWAPALGVAQIAAACEDDLRLLLLERLPLVLLRWQPRPADDDAFLDALHVLIRLRDAGKIERIGLSNVALRHVRLASTATQVAAISNAFSVTSRRGSDVVDWCTKNSVPFLAYYPLLGGDVVRKPEVQHHAATLGLTSAQVAIAWLRAVSPVMLPIPGTRDVRHLRQNVAAHHFVLPRDVLAELMAVRATGIR